MRWTLVTLVTLITTLTAPSTAQDAALVMPNSAACTPPETGEGSSAETAIPVSLEDLVWDADAVWGHGARSEFDCRWIRTFGQFQWMDYWHYRGRLMPNPMGERPSVPNSPWIESFATGSPNRVELHSRNIEIVALYYDLCVRAEAERVRSLEEDGTILLNMGGPCHYSNLNGLMLSDARVVAVHSSTIRIRGEANREAFGNLVYVADVAPEKEGPLREATLQVLSAFAQGERVGLSHTDYSETAVASALEDDDDWTSALVGVSRSLLGDTRSDTQNIEVRSFFETAIYGDDISATPTVGDTSYAFGCACLTETCTGDWPLKSNDAYRMTDEAICVELEETASGTWELSH